MSGPEPAEVLPRSRRALEQARRQLDELHARREDIQGFRDLMPYALERLLNVWRRIDDESHGDRSPEFGTWWAAQKTGNREALAELRNIELKEGSTSKYSGIFRGANAIRKNADGTFDAIRPDGSIAPRTSEGHLDAGEPIMHSVKWQFPGVEGPSGDDDAEEIVELLYTQLETKILPQAMRLIAEYRAARGA